MNRDLNIWRELPALQSGHIPAVPRRWMFVGRYHGEHCRFPVELTSASCVPGTYHCRAVCAQNVMHTPDYVRLDQLEPLD